MNNTGKKVIDPWKLEFLNDYRLAPLLEKHYDKSTYLLDLLAENMSTFSEVYAKLTSIKQNIVNLFNERLGENHEIIAKDLEDLEAFNLNVDSLKLIERKLKSKTAVISKDFTQEYENLLKNLPILEKVYDVARLSKHSIRFLQNVKLLKSLIVNSEIIDLRKGSMIINELFIIAKSMDLAGLSFYENEKEFINNTREALISKTQKKLLASLQSRQEEEIRVCLKTLLNLSILGETVTQIGTNFLKAIMNIWKNFLIKEYDQNTVLLSFSQELKRVLTECLEITNSVWLLKVSLRNNDDLQKVQTDKNLINIFELFCNKEVNIIAQSFLKLKENSGKFEINWKVAIRSFPKIYSAFEEFLAKFRENWLIYPDFSTENEKFSQDFARDLMNSILFIKDLYYSWLKTELEIRFMGALTSVFPSDPTKTKDYLDICYQNACKVMNFVQYEIEENVKTPEIFNRAGDIFAKEMKTFMILMIEKTLKEPFEEVFVGTLFIALNVVAKVGSDSMNLLLSNKNNLKLSLEEIDEFIDLYEDSIEKLSSRFFEKVFSEILKIFSLFYENYSKNQKLSFQAYCWESLNFLLLTHSPLKFANLIEKNSGFNESWEEFLLIFVNMYGFLMSNFSIPSEKFLEIINKDIDVLNTLVEKITRKDNTNKISMIVINIQKLFFLDATNFSLMNENNPALFTFISKDLAIFHFLKRAEREANLKKKNEGLLDILGGILGNNEVRYVKWREGMLNGRGSSWREGLENVKKSIGKENENVKLLEKLIG